MDASQLNRVKLSLLKALDGTVQRYYHQRLEEIMNDLHLHNIDLKPDPSADEVFATVWKNRILDCSSAPAAVEMRGTLERLQNGTFGQCVRCGREIPAETLEPQPMTELCQLCSLAPQGNPDAVYGHQF